MWSYWHRREHTDTTLSDSQRRIWNEKCLGQQDFENFLDCQSRVRELCTNSNVIELSVPDWAPLQYIGFFKNCAEKQPISVARLDCARDGQHFDIITAEWVAEQVAQRLVT